jgi:ParB family transcriptional regulator, chromosome partitioning protein
LLENIETDITAGIDSESAKRVLGSIANIEIEKIEANPFQPRATFNKEALIELSESIKQHGVIQPVTVRKLGNNNFQLISGERRFRASQIAGLTEIPAYIRVANDQTMLEMALVENIQREDLDPIEVAISYKRLIEECKLTQEGLSEKVAKNRTTVTNFLRLLKLPVDIQAGLRERKLTMGHARTLVNIPEEKEQLKIYNKILEEGLSVRQTEEISSLAKNNQKSTRNTTTYIPLSFEHQKIKSELTDKFGTKIDLKRDVTGKGKIEIPFATEDELLKILSVLDI